MTWGSFNAEEPLAWEQMDALWDAGCNFFDTAEMYPVAFNYGKTTEQWMGNWLAKRVRRHCACALHRSVFAREATARLLAASGLEPHCD
jgi:aryl-alcohol dehydrogenase-like predicted oxidoreductase